MQCQLVKTLAVHCYSNVCSAASGHSGGCRSSWVCLQHHATWWHLMVLQYVAASFHLPAVSTATFITLQYPLPFQQCEMSTIPAVVISKVLSPQSNIVAVFVNSNGSIFFDVSSCLPKYIYHNVTKFKLLFSTPLPADPSHPSPKCQNCQHTAMYLIFSMPHRNVLITLFNWVTNCECWIVAEKYRQAELDWFRILKWFIKRGLVQVL